MESNSDLALKIGDVNVSDCKDAIEAAKKRLDAVKKYVDVGVGKDIRQLDNVVQSLKDSLGVKEQKDVPKENVDTNDILKNARTMKEIVDKVYQFEYEQRRAGGMVTCRVCEATFKYSNNHSSSVRGITDQDRLEDEVWVAINGPEVVHCEGIVREAIRVGKGGGHFI